MRLRRAAASLAGGVQACGAAVRYGRARLAHPVCQRALVQGHRCVVGLGLGLGRFDILLAAMLAQTLRMSVAAASLPRTCNRIGRARNPTAHVFGQANKALLLELSLRSLRATGAARRVRARHGRATACPRAGLKQIDARQYTVWDLYQAAEESQVRPGRSWPRRRLRPARALRDGLPSS